MAGAKCGLTPRSTGPATASTVSLVRGTWCIISYQAYGACLRRPVSSNVRPHNPPMRSLWTVSYVGAHTATTIKKLERFLSLKALDIERERYVWEGENLERSAFFVEHGSLEWPALLVSLLQKTSTLASTWQAHGDAVQTFTVQVASESVNTQFRIGIPTGLREISWTVRTDQQFPNVLLSTGSSSIARW